jgi:hypothetical protein
MKLILYPLAFILFLAAPALGAITSVANLGAANSTSSGTSLVITLADALAIENVAVVRIAADNFGTASGMATEVLSVVDSSGNTYERICEYRYSEGVAGDKALVSLWSARAAAGVAISGTITITFGNAITSKAAQAQEFGVTDGNKLQIAGTCKTENIANADAGSLTTDTLPSKEYLFYRAIAFEANADALTTPTTSYTGITGSNANTGTNALSMGSMGERRILTGTADTSDPTMSGTRDGASIFVALEECTPGVDCTGDAVAAPIGQLRRRSN